MASAFKEPKPILAHVAGQDNIVYLFESANKAAAFTHADVKSILQVCRGQRKSAMRWNYYFQESIDAQELAQLADRKVVSLCTAIDA